MLLVTPGTGLDFRHLPAEPVVAIEFSMEMLQPGRRVGRSAAAVTLLAADAERLPFESVVCSWSLCSTHDPDRALREVYRVPRQGGALLLFEHVWSRHTLLARRSMP